LAWVAEAQRDLADAITFISERSPKAARALAVRVEERAHQLLEYPELGRPGRMPMTRELVVTGTPYLLIYTIRGQIVEIVRVLHGAQDWPPKR
jgi:toxin ParE1/3/4